MTITSTSSLEDVVAQYMDNLDWDGNVTKARLALQAVRALLIIRPTATDFRGQRVSFDATQLTQQEKRLMDYVANQSSVSKRCFFMRGRCRT